MAAREQPGRGQHVVVVDHDPGLSRELPATLDVGIDRNAPVTTYPRGRGFAFTGEIEHVTIAVGDDAVPVPQRDELDAVLVAQ